MEHTESAAPETAQRSVHLLCVVQNHKGELSPSNTSKAVKGDIRDMRHTGYLDTLGMGQRWGKNKGLGQKGKTEVRRDKRAWPCVSGLAGSVLV